ncbi:hypothetical protein [Rufibacter roseolus]|uniref:hypothetical protein n=1 Tax=Rufibacter roseolus TaxID=2817375 RepID=UPI001B30F42F|nr:hypothetical protein [Rufibacter roseolus]
MMIIYENGFVKIHYDPAEDIMFATLPQIDNSLFTEVRRSYDIVVDHVKSYDVKKLLIDASQTQVKVPEEVLLPIFSHFIKGLSSSRLQRLARIISSNISRERIIELTFMHTSPPFQYEGFPHSHQAIT